MEKTADQIEVRQTQRGWLASIRARGLAVQAPTRDQAVRDLKDDAKLIDKLASRWRKTDSSAI